MNKTEKDLFHQEIGTRLSAKGFNRKRNLYYRIYGDCLLQTICAESGRRVYAGGSPYIFLNIEPLYGQMQFWHLPTLSLNDLCYFNFDRMEKCRDGFEEKVDLFCSSYIDMFDKIAHAKDLLQIKQKWWSDFEMEDEEEEEPDEYELYFMNLYPDVAENTSFHFQDDGMLYAAIRNGQYEEAVSHITNVHFFQLAMLKEKLERGGCNRKEYEEELEELKLEDMQRLQLCDLMRNRDSEKIEDILDKNYIENIEILTKRLKLKLDFVNAQ